ncbi:Hypothetical_protein [Hexamita inflata]|uniref:Hypothetical_protein n=1 Tax=Hexamita inflata TaxID=28002 RepID=A0AA86PPE2_9EUKA|nr:Hypothetical protein HINF_LOCUS26317 [Hexamita inflata]
MNICTFRQRKLFGTFETTAFYEIQNNCIMLHYYVRSSKVEHYYRVEDLASKALSNNVEQLIDARKNITIEIQGKAEADSLKHERAAYPDDVFVNFESNGLKAYTPGGDTLEKNSFSPEKTSRLFE